METATAMKQAENVCAMETIQERNVNINDARTIALLVMGSASKENVFAMKALKEMTVQFLQIKLKI